MCPHHTDSLKTKAPNTTGSNHLYNTLELLMMGIVVPETCWASNKIYNKNHLLHLVGILFPHINDDARSKSHQSNFIHYHFSALLRNTINRNIHHVDLKNSINTATFILNSKSGRLTILTTRYVMLQQCGPSITSSVTTSTARYYKFLLLFINIIDVEYIHNNCVRTT